MFSHNDHGNKKIEINYFELLPIFSLLKNGRKIFYKNYVFFVNFGTTGWKRPIAYVFYLLSLGKTTLCDFKMGSFVCTAFLVQKSWQSL